jgi:cell division protein ZapA
MPEVEVSIGGRFFEVACQEGEEHFLQLAAKLLNGEASNLTNQMGRLSEGRMLLMAGLMLADKAAGLDDQLREIEDKLRSQDQLIIELRAAADTGGDDAVAEPSAELQGLVNRSEVLADLVEKFAATG